MSDVAATPIDVMAARARHVRDFWQAAESEEHGFRVCEAAVGALLITRLRHRLDEGFVTIAGHVGIVTCITDEVRYIDASPARGDIKERFLINPGGLLGYVAVAL